MFMQLFSQNVGLTAVDKCICTMSMCIHFLSAWFLTRNNFFGLLGNILFSCPFIDLWAKSQSCWSDTHFLEGENLFLIQALCPFTDMPGISAFCITKLHPKLLSFQEESWRVHPVRFPGSWHGASKKVWLVFFFFPVEIHLISPSKFIYLHINLLLLMEALLIKVVGDDSSFGCFSSCRKSTSCSLAL